MSCVKFTNQLLRIMFERKWLFVFVLCAFYHRFYTNAKICENVRVSHSSKHLERSLRGCTKVIGYLQVILLESYDIKEIEFPELKEITGFVLFYRVYGLESVGKLFPNLGIIGGDRLFLDYALVLYEVPHLREIGLKSLRYLGRGSTRIEKCPQLCYVDTIDWDAIGGSTHYLHYYNKNDGDCPSCPSHCEGLCWNNDNCQNSNVGKCENDCVLCNEYNECERCKIFLDNNKCTNFCPKNKYGHSPTATCVTKEECEEMGDRKWYIFNDQCTKVCPKNYFKVSKEDGWCKYCGNNCTKICEGAVIGHVQDADRYRDCTNINGNLEISLHEDLTSDQLAFGLGSIKIINGYLMIYKSHGITSLHFLKNLKVISGKTLYQSKYSVAVFDNKNLEKLWDWNKLSLNIERGTVLFHYNPKLCRTEIETLVKLSQLSENYTKYDVSPYSNGEESLCTVFDALIEIVDVSPTKVKISWKVSVGDVIGYLLYYIEDPDGNITVHEMQKVDQYNNKQGRFAKYIVDNKMLVSDLDSYTKYAFYIQISTETAYFAGRTEIHRFRTKPGKPTVPQQVQVLDVNYTTIKLSWKPPIKPGGIIERYEVSVHHLKDDDILTKDVEYCHRTQVKLEESLRKVHCTKERLNIRNVYILDTILNENNTIEEIQVNNDSTEYTFSNLEYFGNYELYLRVCNNIRWCSQHVVLYQRTKPYLDADSIPSEISVKIIAEGSALVQWLPPLKPNSYVASYLVRYRNIELEHSVATEECVTVHQYLKYKGYIIKNLPPGMYEATVNVVSLAGVGKLSNPLSFKIEKVETTTLTELYLVLSAFLLGFIFITFFYFYFKKIKYKKVSIEKDLVLTLINEGENLQSVLGVVRNGFITSQNRPCTIKFGSKHNTKEMLLNEVEKMRNINSSHHVVALLGLARQSKQYLLIMELMSWGDLKSFLLHCGSSFELTEERVTRMAAEIADGLLYLSSRKIVHPDLAARNCLVSAGFTVKVTTFGINRDVYEDDYYNDKKRGVIPVRWMAPETITDGVVNSKSNIWSYGIIIWEIITNAKKPYEDLSDSEVMRYVIGQNTMKRPNNCTDLMYSIICDCWKWKSANRTNYPNILKTLRSHLRRDFKLVSFYCSFEGVKFVNSLKSKSFVNEDTIVRWKALEKNVTLGVNKETLYNDFNLPSTSYG
ncbi:hypothetical protein FQR65_LT10826 [Abscondita terminalis]|nr:hypothetical protein FQR65_LT10826 [Abscondita terminalis]